MTWLSQDDLATMWASFGTRPASEFERSVIPKRCDHRSLAGDQCPNLAEWELVHAGQPAEVFACTPCKAVFERERIGVKFRRIKRR